MNSSHVILSLNSGSSSLKFALYRLSEGLEKMPTERHAHALVTWRKH